MRQATAELRKIIGNSSSVVFFGGAGVSTASGIPDFRSADGIFSRRYGRNLSPEELVSHDFFMKDRKTFYKFYREHLVYPDALPNACHTALAALEKEGKLSAVITQNIDGLHQMAGSRNVYELHGSVHRNHCISCGKFYDGKYIRKQQGIPICTCGGVIKPDVVLYGEALDDDVLNGAVKEISGADTLIIGGTSLVVYPAAGLIRYFRGNNLVLINKTITPADEKATLVIHDDIAKVMGSIYQ